METNPLSLIIKEKTLGCLVTNAKDIKAYVEEKLKEYSVDNYTGDAKQAAKDKAEINNAIKTLNDRRLALEKEAEQLTIERQKGMSREQASIKQTPKKMTKKQRREMNKK
mgnify:CR=1 FL=1